jgi:hypothetical protein
MALTPKHLQDAHEKGQEDAKTIREGNDTIPWIIVEKGISLRIFESDEDTALRQEAYDKGRKNGGT